MKWPWQRHRDAQIEAEKADTEFEWAVQNRTTVQAIVERIKYHGDRNGLIEDLNTVIRGHK